MEAQDLKDRLKHGEDLILLDVREPDEIAVDPYFLSPPKYFLNIPVLPLIFSSKQELKERIFGTLGLPETTPVITLCQTGGRSQRACEELRRHGWKAENLEGGILAWDDPM